MALGPLDTCKFAGTLAGVGANCSYDPPVPFTHAIPWDVLKNKTIVISGIPSQRSSRFNINFLVGRPPYETCAFTFDVRFDFGKSSKKVLVCNTMTENVWGTEERSNRFPFKPDTFFDMIIRVDDTLYKITVNDQLLLEFKHRHSARYTETIKIDGDVKLYTVRFL